MKSKMIFNQRFISNISEIYGQAGERWLNNLENKLTAICNNHYLELISIMPNLSYNFVGLARKLENDEPAILKIAYEKKYIINEANFLKCFINVVPKIEWFDENENAILMEYLEPGYSLKKLVKEDKDEQATKIICQTIQALQKNQQSRMNFKHVSELANDLLVLEGNVEDKLLSHALSLFHELSSDKSHDVILHGDLHHDNILASGNTWKVIDAHGYIGDPVFEVGSIIFNPCDCLPVKKSLAQLIKRRLDIMTNELPFDAQRIKAWTFCKTLLSVAWTFADHGKIDEGELEIAKRVHSLS